MKNRIVSVRDDREIVIQLPSCKNPDRLIDLISKSYILTFKLVDEENVTSAQASGIAPEGSELLTMKVRNRETGVITTASILLKKHSILTGEFITDAQVRDSGNEKYVGLELNSEGAKIFEKATGDNIGKRMAIVLNDTVYSAPVIREKISGGRVSVTGGFSTEEAKDLAIILMAGSYPVHVKLVEYKSLNQNIWLGAE